MSGTDQFSDRETLDEQLQAQAHIWNHIYCMANSMSLKCAVELGIPDIIQEHGRPISLSELIAAIRIPPHKAENFRRLLRLLVHNGIFSTQRQEEEINHRNDEEAEEIKYDLTPCSRLLVRKNRVNLADQVLLELNPLVLSPWEHLSRWFKKEGSTPFEDANNGTSLWDYAGQRDDVNRMLNEGMSSDSRLMVSALIAKCGVVFRGVKSLVDVGGGTGTTARALVQAFPDMNVTVLDLPHVVAEAPNNKLNGVVGFVGGDMFDHIPPADAVFLKWIFHCWSDEESVKILRKCREAIPDEGGKVIIVDMVVDPTHRDEDHFKTQLFTDLLVMLHTPGKERDEQQWKKIFIEAGFSRYNIIPGLGLRSVIEVFP